MKLSEEIINKYFNNISKLHNDKQNKNGFEKNDRDIFIRDFLGNMGYNLENILDDVSQKMDEGSRSPDIRLFGDYEVKNKLSHSQFVIETKNYNLLDKNIDNIDFLQLKRYIKANQSKIRLICATDYVTLFLFNATEIKKTIRMDNMNSISAVEKEIFKKNIFTVVEFDNLHPKVMKDINTISYDTVFKKQVFINPEEFESTNSITDSSVRKNFILTLYSLMVKFEDDLKHELYDKINTALNSLQNISVNSPITMSELLLDPKNPIVRNYTIWGTEMNYISNFSTHIEFELEKKEKIDYLKNNEYKEAFLLTSVYNLINKTFFLRILEDTSTKNTRFIKGKLNYRYLSNGILTKMYYESEEVLIEYLKNVYEFQENDLRKYSFLLKKDIYSWVLDYVSSNNLLNFIRLFNDTNFKKLSQDILGDIYEHYLEQADSEEQEKTYRRLLGQYYTPKPIVRFIWMLIRDTVKNVLKRDIYEKDKPYLTILDPACGSGSFLGEAILQINATANKKQINNDGKVFAFIKDRDEHKKMEDNIFGFELNPLSKSIADINMFFGLTQAYGYTLDANPIENLKIFRTDSFDLEILFSEGRNKQMNSFLYSEEIRASIIGHEAVNSAKETKYDIIVGNPPYGPIQPTKFMKEHLIPYAYAENNFDTHGNEISYSRDNSNFTGNVPAKEKNRGKLTDMYAFFFGVADLLVKKNGMIAFITSNTYLTIPTYKWMRKYWLENYKIHYIVNFNDISERSNSMFTPEAAVATSIIIMSKGTPNKNNKIRYLNLSNINDIPEKYSAFCNNIVWNARKKDKNDIKSFIIKNLEEIPFIEVLQKSFINKNDYIISYSKNDEILDIIEKQSVSLTTYSDKNTGVDVGDLNYLVDISIAGIKDKIINYVFAGNLKNFSKTSKDYILTNIESDKINKNFDAKCVLPFVYQKHMQRYGYSKKYYTYLDPNILWRSRLKNKEDIFDNPITCKVKLGVVEKRGIGEIFAFVSNEIILPQHGGRFMYLVPNTKLSENDIYLMAGIINSNIVQLYYKLRQQGDKNVLIKKIEDIPLVYKNELIDLSKEIHLLIKDKLEFEKENVNFATQWFKDEIESKIEIYNITDECSFWKLIPGNEMFQDYTINEAKLDVNDKTIIILNSELKIEIYDPELATKIYDTYFKKYSGDITKDSILINVTKLKDSKLYQNYIGIIDMKLKLVNEALNNIVYKIYGLEDKANLINNLLDQHVK